MNKFVMGLSNLVSEECRSAMLISDMDLSRLMTYAEQIEGEKLRKRRSGEAKRVRFDGKFQGLKSGKFHQGQGTTHAPNRRSGNDNPRVQGDGGVALNTICPKCGRAHRGPCLRGTNAYFDCGEVGHKKVDCPRNQNKGGDIHP